MIFKKIFISNKTFFFILSAIFSIFVISRLFLLPVHFAHGDDSAIGHIIWIFNSYNVLEIKYKLAEYNKNFSFLLYLLDNFPSLFFLIKFLLTPLAIVQNSSYAPLQFFQTAIFANFDISYVVTLISVRFASFLNSLFTLIIVFIFFRRLEKKNYEIPLIASFLIICLSWMYLIYSSLALNTATIVLVSSIFLYLLLKLDSININFKISILVGILISFLILLHYQSIIFLPGFYLALLYLTGFKFKFFFRKWAPCIAVNIFSFIAIYSYYLTRIITVHWNIGVNSEFLFNNNILSQNSYDIIIYTLTFFISNFFLTIQSVVSFTDIQGFISKAYTILIIIFSIFCLFFFDKKRKDVVSVIIFILITFFFWFILIIFQKITLSPTRHSLFLLIPISFLASYGFFLFTKKIKLSIIVKNINLFLYFFLFCLFAVYLNNFFIEREKRFDPFQKINYEEILEKYKVSTVVTYGFPPSQFYFPYINKYFVHKVGPSDSIIYYKKNNYLKNQFVAFVGTRNSLTNSTQENNYYKSMINFIYGNSFKDYNYKKDYYKNEEILKDTSNKKNLKLIYEYKFISDTEVDYGNLTKNGSNNLIIKIFKLDNKL